MVGAITAAYRVKESRTPAQIAFKTNEDIFSCLASQGSAKKFQDTAIAQSAKILADYPWEEITDMMIMDIGGGGGGLIATLLRKFPSLQGAIYDRPEVVEQAIKNFHTDGGEYSDVGQRVPRENLIASDFFEKVPLQHVYCMKWCLHD